MVWEDQFVSLAAFTNFCQWWPVRSLTLEWQFQLKDLEKYNPIVLRQFKERKGWMWFTQSVVDAKEYLVRELYANVAHIKKGTKVTKVRNLKVRFDKATLNTYLGFEDVKPKEYLEKYAMGDKSPALVGRDSSSSWATTAMDHSRGSYSHEHSEL